MIDCNVGAASLEDGGAIDNSAAAELVFFCGPIGGSPLTILSTSDSGTLIVPAGVSNVTFPFFLTVFVP
jgi:hypothetical protein